MRVLVSGEGPTDIGGCERADPCAGEDFMPGPMAWLADQVIEDRLGFSPIGCGLVHCLSETRLADAAKSLRPPSLRGRRRAKETAFFFRTAREVAAAQDDEVIAILFRDADGTQSAARGDWQDKWDSILSGFAWEHFSTGVPMLPCPKSEAWLICALKRNLPYQHCAQLEQASGNDRGKNPLKQQLAAILDGQQNRVVLADLVKTRQVCWFSRNRNFALSLLVGR
ncbi:MAG: hypothetical protein EA400_01145, partial [Chromatiaceae bacterium]